MTIHTTTPAWIAERARELGFPAVGIAAIEPMDPSPLREWLAAGYAAEMEYLHRHLPLRANLENVLSGARSVICAALPYPGPTHGESLVGAVARYARGADYHDVVRERLQQLWSEVKEWHPGAEGRIFVDGGPLPERELARRAGLGWVGKHSCLIHSDLGTRFVLGEILTTLELPPSTAVEGSCGNCRICLDACPTGALVAPGVIDARRCLSYLTIEHRGPIPRELRPLFGTRLFGCDTCQDICPHNRRVGEVATPLTPAPDLLAPNLCSLLLLTPEGFNTRYRGTPIHRAKLRGLLRNACVALGNLGDPATVPALRIALHDSEPLVRGHVAWALGRLGEREFLRIALETENDSWVREEIQEAIASRL